jgi:hypothetical protein
MTPVYEDVKNGIEVPNNKITLAPHTDREYTYLLKEHFGKEGRKKDLTWTELSNGFMQAMDFRTSGLKTPETDEAIKN